MKPIEIWIPDGSPVMSRAGDHLRDRGIKVVRKATPATTHLLLPVPIRSGAEIPPEIPEGIPILGGNLPTDLFSGHNTIDLLQDPQYLYDNAAITAHCAIRIAAERLPRVWAGCQVLIIGWGRIGKFLAKYLNALGAGICVAARKPEDRALIRALGFQAAAPDRLAGAVGRYRVIFNTAPALILPEDVTSQCKEDAVLIDLASKPGIEGVRVIAARGLPGKMAPESSGDLIGRTALRLIHAEEVSI